MAGAKKYLNLARVYTTTVGTGTITLGSAVSTYLTFAAAGAVNNDVYYYSIYDTGVSPAAREVGYGTYNSSAGTLTRNLIKSTTGSLLNLSGSADVSIIFAAEALTNTIHIIGDGSTSFSNCAVILDNSGASGRKFAVASRESGEFAISDETSAAIRFLITSGGVCYTNNIYPFSDNASSLGASGARFSAVWAANGTIQTSDAASKTDVADSMLGLDFIKLLRPVSYRWRVGGNAVDQDGRLTPIAGKRTHWGLIAQEVETAARQLGVDFGGHIVAEDGLHGLRYDQFIAPIVKAIQELSNRLDKLEGRA